MDPHTGERYTKAEAERLPTHIQDRLVWLPESKPEPVKHKNRKAKTYDMPAKNTVEQRRKASKQAKQARKKNRK